nr:hypothetical protein [uncultured Capnocytophaga sp.]
MYFLVHPIKKAAKQYANEKQRKQQNIQHILYVRGEFLQLK